MNNHSEKKLFLLAHTDDEIGIALKMKDEVERGSRVFVAWLTSGVKRLLPERQMESHRAMDFIGVPQTNRIFFEFSERDLHFDFERPFERVKELLLDLRPREIFVPAWEGGHVDHDFTNLMTYFALKESGTRATLFEFPLYNLFRLKLRVLEFIPQRTGVETCPITFERYHLLERVLRAHQSQWFHLSFWRRFLNEKKLLAQGLTFRRVPAHDYTRPPHAWPLLTQFVKPFRYRRFLKQARVFIRLRRRPLA